MNLKRIVGLTVAVATLLVASAAVFTPPASAAVYIRVNAAPPPLRHEEVIVRPSGRHVWVPGYWDWAPARHDYVWVGGRWALPPRAHAVWVGPRWVYRHHQRYLVRGYWR